jgi:hypothetical protein
MLRTLIAAAALIGGALFSQPAAEPARRVRWRGVDGRWQWKTI